MKRQRFMLHPGSGDAPSALAELLAQVRNYFPADTAVGIRRSQGYGKQINEWDRALDGADSVSSDLGTLERLLGSEGEMFDWLTAELPEVGISFGLHDSSLLFVVGAEDASTIARALTDFEIVGEDPL